MSDQLFEVAFSGRISAGADLNEVRARVARMFNADAAKIEQLFSGKRIVIKKNIDQATAAKYQTAMNRAGAECEVRPMDGGTAAAAKAPEAGAGGAAGAADKPAAAAGGVSMTYETGDYGEVAPPPQVDPLGISGDQIEDLEATVAPVGSELKDSYTEVEEPQFDISEFAIAPVGSDLSSAKKAADPPPPDTTGITLAD